MTALDNMSIRLDIPNGICKITSIYDCDLSRIAHPLEECMSSFYDVHAFLPGPHPKCEQNALMHESLLGQFPEPLPRPVTSAVDKTQLSYGSGTNIDWELSKSFIHQLELAGARTPRTIPHARMLCALSWFVQTLVPIDLIAEDWTARDRDQVQMRRADIEEVLRRYLDEFDR